MKLKDSGSLEENYDKSRQRVKKQRHYFTDKGLYSQNYAVSSGHVWIWELDYKESWVLKNWCFWSAALEKTLESPLDCKDIQSVNPKGNQFWISIGRTDAEAPILWLPDESHHARPPCPSSTPGVHSNSRPLSWWCHPAISSSVVPFSSSPQSLPASESFPMSELFT